MKTIGFQGGYLTPSPAYAALNTTYLYQKPNGYVPTREQVEEDLKQYLQTSMPSCMTDLREALPGTNITEQAFTTAPLIRDQDVFFQLTWPFTASKGETTFSFEQFANTVDIRLALILDNAQAMVVSQQNNNDLIDLDELQGENLELVFFPYKQTLTTLANDLEYKTEEPPYRFIFGHQR